VHILTCKLYTIHIGYIVQYRSVCTGCTQTSQKTNLDNKLIICIKEKTYNNRMTMVDLQQAFINIDQSGELVPNTLE
jgi:hypothetical protein